LATYDVAHFKEHGVDLVVIFVAESVQHTTDAEKRLLSNKFMVCAKHAGLAGHVVLVWPGGFFADPHLHPFFASVPYQLLVSNINKKLTCHYT
jgi:hypothetical protein